MFNIESFRKPGLREPPAQPVGLLGVESKLTEQRLPIGDREDCRQLGSVPALLRFPQLKARGVGGGTASEPPKPITCSGTESFPLWEDHTEPMSLKVGDPHVKDVGPTGTVSLTN